MNYIKIPIDSVVKDTLFRMKDGAVSLLTYIPITIKPYNLLVTLEILEYVPGPDKDRYYVVFKPGEKCVLEHYVENWYVKVPVE